MVSKRCCPSCDILATILRGTSFSRNKYPLIYPGSHALWSPVSLPPWIPKRVGEELINQAANILGIRFNQIKRLLSESENVRKHSLSLPSDVPTEEPRRKRPRRELSQIVEENELQELSEWDKTGMDSTVEESQDEGDDGEDSEVNFSSISI